MQVASSDKSQYTKWAEKHYQTLCFLMMLAGMILGQGLRFSKVYFFHIALVFTGTSLLKKRDLKVCFPFLSIVFFWSISSLWSINSKNSIKYSMILAMGITGSLILYRNFSFRNFKKWGITLWLLQAFIGLLEVFTPFRYPISTYSGLNSLFLVSHKAGTIVDIHHPGYQNLATGTLWGANAFSLFILISMPFGLFLKKKIQQSLFFLTSSFLVINNLSRSSYLGLVIMIFGIALLYLQIHKKLNKKTLFAILLSISTGFFAILHTTQVGDRLKNLVENIQKYQPGQLKTSTAMRINYYRFGMKAFLSKPIFGHGAGNSGNTSLHPYSNHDISIHSFPLEILVDTGITGFVLIAALFLLLLFKLYSKMLKSEGNQRFFTASCLLSLISFLPASHGLSSPIYFLPFYALLGLALVAVFRLEDIKND